MSCHINVIKYNNAVIEYETTKAKRNMKIFLGILCMLVVAGATTAAVVITTREGSPAISYTGPIIYNTPPFNQTNGFIPLWWDEFDDDVLDRTKWSVETNNIPGDGQIQHFIDDDSSLMTNNGSLMIIADNQGGVNYDGNNYESTYYTSARINTKSSGGSWFPGMSLNGSIFNTIKVESRLKAAHGPGLVNAMWMLPADIGSCYIGEIDIFETIRCNSEVSGVWLGTENSKENKLNFKNTNQTMNVCDDFHVYSMEWSKEGIRFFIDDVDIGFAYSFSWDNICGNTDPYLRPFYLIANVNIGGNWAGNPDNSTPFPSVMEIDYIRVSGKTV